MKWVLAPVVLATLAFAVACGGRTLDSEGVADDNEVSDPPTEDPNSCGEAKADCVGPLGIGECVDGECTGQLFGCWTAGTTCAEACAVDPGEGATCAASACAGATAYAWVGSDPELAPYLCGSQDGATPLQIGCDDALPFGDYAAIMCCCAW